VTSAVGSAARIVVVIRSSHLRADDRLGGTEFRSALLSAEAELAAWAGRPDEAWTVAEEGFGQFHAGPLDPSLAWLGVHVIRAQTDAIERLGPGSATEDRRATLEARVGRIDGAVTAALGGGGEGGEAELGDRVRALLAMYRAEHSRERGPGDPARWSACVAAWQAIGRPFQVAYASWRLAGATLGAGGAREIAGQSLREAHAIALELGAAPLVVAIETLARQARIGLGAGGEGRAGARVAAAADASGYDFTPREAEVLHLVASGWTNQQIADALFITRKTASVHVSNLLAKLGVSNRGEAAALAVRIGLVKDLAPAPIATE